MTTYTAETLFDPIVDIDHDPELTLQERYEAFAARNPHVMRAIERICDEWVAAGGRRLGMGAIFEQLRWRSGIATQGDPWLLNNSFRSRYTRDLMAHRPDLAPLFSVRELRAA